MKVKVCGNDLTQPLLKGATATLLALGLSATAQAADGHTTLNIKGNAEVDTDAVSNVNGSDSDDYGQGGRIKITFDGKHESDIGYVASEVELKGEVDGDVSVDEAYVKFGQKNWSVLLGRYEATDLFSKGVDTAFSMIGSAGETFYQANAARGRDTGTAGHIVFDFTPNDRFRFELGTLWGESIDDVSELDDEDLFLAGADSDDAFTGVRPIVEFDVTDDFRVTAGYDYLSDDDIDIKGYGLYLRYATDAFVVKGNYAQGKREEGSVDVWDNTAYNINVESGPFGLGYTYTEDDVSNEDASNIYGNYTINNLMGVKSAQAKLAFSYAEASDVDNEELLLRLRLNYDF